MTSVSRQQHTVKTSSVNGDWDHGLNRLLEDLQGTTVTRPEGQQNVSEFREYRTYSSSKKNDEPVQTTSEKWVEYGTQGGGGPGISHRLKDSTYSSRPSEPSNPKWKLSDRSVTPPPPQSEGLKTPPLVRKILQSSTTSHNHSTNKKTSTDYDSTKPLCARMPLNSSSPVPNEPTTAGSRYYTSTTTRTERHKNQEISPGKSFPSAQPREYYGEPPKRLDDLMSTFQGSYTTTETSRKIHGDGSGPYPYGPGTGPIEPVRQVRIDDNVTSRTIIDEEHGRKNASNYNQNPLYQPKEVEPTRNVAGPAVYYPSNKVFHTIEQESKVSVQDGGKGNMKAKRKTEYKVKEKNVSNPKGRRVECQPVCCACSIV